MTTKEALAYATEALYRQIDVEEDEDREETLYKAVSTLIKLQQAID